MIVLAVLGLLALVLVLRRVRRRRAARSVAADAASSVLTSVLLPVDRTVVHRSPRTARRWAGSRGRM